MKQQKNISASVRQRLLNYSRSHKRPFNEVLQYFASDRFLYRLSTSEYADRFILKGALLLKVWDAPELRPTMDIDLAGRTSNNEENIQSIFKEIIRTDNTQDGLIFFEETVVTRLIKEESEYHGVRVLFKGELETARINMQIDVGFNDIIIPSPERRSLPAMLDFPPTILNCYNRDSVIGEKFETIVKLGYQNSRMKDFYDIWLLSSNYNFNGSQLAETMEKIFKHRNTSYGQIIFAFEDDFADKKNNQWNAFIKKIANEQQPLTFHEVLKQLKLFLKPVIDSLAIKSPIPHKWKAPGPWSLE